jgi:hypothetical protein
LPKVLKVGRGASHAQRLAVGDGSTINAGGPPDPAVRRIRGIGYSLSRTAVCRVVGVSCG